MDDIAALERSLQHFHSDGLGCYITCTFFDMEDRYMVNGGSRSGPLVAAMRNVHHDLWQASCLVSRLAWMRTQFVDGQLNETLWRLYSQLDIENYFVQLRSLLDYLGTVIEKTALKPGQVPTSFRQLRESLETYRSKLRPAVASAIAAATWTDEL